MIMITIITIIIMIIIINSFFLNDLIICVHPLLTKKQVKAKEWISSNSKAFEALQKIVLSKNILTPH